MFYRFIIARIAYYVNRFLFLILLSFKEMIFQQFFTLFHIFLIIMPILTIGFKRGVLHACPNHFISKKSAIVAMSGGVDTSVTAFLRKTSDLSQLAFL